MLDTYSDCWNRVLLRCPNLSPKLSQDFVRNAFRRLAELRRWSWLVKVGQFIAPTAYNTGTVTTIQNQTIITGSGTTWTGDMVGRQFRVGLAAPIYTILSVSSTTQLELDQPWGGPSSSNAGYLIFQCYFTVPNDFHQFISLWDPSFNWQLYLDVQQTELNIWDAQRSNAGNVYVVSFYDYSLNAVGVVGPILQVNGSGNAPFSAGSYTGPANAIFTVTIQTGGAPGTAIYRWKKNSSAITGVITNVDGTADELMDGVFVTFPLGVSYTAGDVFVISCLAQPNSGLPRYELWPHQQSEHVYPFLYETRPIDISDQGATLPRYIRGDVVVEMALEDVCLWPGPSLDKPNPYYSPVTARYHADRLRAPNALGMLDVLERQDDEVWQQDLSYAYPSLSFAYADILGDARFLQSHAI